MADINDKEPTFQVYNPNNSDLSEDKKKILEAEKNKAVNMVKLAYFRDNMQDPYPSPFLNLSDMNIPKKSTDIFKWCKYFYMFDPLIAGAINSLATFPITDIYLEDTESENDTAEKESDQLRLYKKIFFKTINIYKLLIEIGIDYWLYGNCFIFGEMYKNPNTGEKEWKHITRLDPSKMIIDVNQATQEKKYKWQVPERIVNIVKTQKPRDEYNKIPQMIKDAVLQKKALVLKSENIYHFARPTDSMGNSAWGTPGVANVLKLLMYRNVLRQAQEALAREHIVPFRIYYFEKTENYNTQIDWTKVAQDFASELNKVAQDPNYKVISPVPVNVLTIGGQGRALLLGPEIEQVQAEILAGVNVPREFIFGGVSYSGSSVSLKILENNFITYRLLLKDFMQNFVIRGMAKARGEWHSDEDDDSLISVRMADLKMQDDVQQKQLIISLNSAGKVTDEFMWKVIGVDPDKMRKALEKEAKLKIELEALVEVERAKNSVAIAKAQLDAQFEIEKYKQEMQKKMIKAGLMPDPAAMAVDANGNAVPGGDIPGQPGPSPDGGMQDGGMQGGGVQAMPASPAVSNPTPNTQAKAKEDNGESQMSADTIIRKLSELSPQQRQAYISQLSPDAQKIVTNGLKQIDNQKYQGQGYTEAQKIALQVMRMPEEQRGAAMEQLNLPESLKHKVVIMMEQMKPDQQKEADGTDMRPMPEQKPPRRNSLK